MTDPQHIDPERLAALLDGRLSDTDAANVRAQLAAMDDDTLGAYADAVAISSEVGGAGASGGSDVLPLGSTRRRVRWVMPTLAAAAVLVATLVTLRTSRSHDDAFEPYRVASGLATNVRVPSSTVWSVSRGAAEDVSSSALAARVGALAMDMEVAVRRADSIHAQASAMSALLGSAPSGSVAAARFRPFSDPASAPPSPQLLREAVALAFNAVDRRLAQLAASLEALRIASVAGDTSFVTAHSVPDLESLLPKAQMNANARQSSSALLRTLRAQPRDLGEIDAVATTLLRALTE